MSEKIRAIKRLNAVLSSDAFIKDAGNIRECDEDYGPMIYALIGKYRLLQSHYPIVKAVIEGKSVKEALKTELDPVAYIIDHSKRTVQPDDDPRQIYDIAEATNGFRTGVTIQLSSDVTRDDIIDFIKDNYSTHIRPALKKYKRLHDPIYALRDETIRKQKANGASVQELADEHNISVPRIYQILKQKL